ncbi:hypothetical protein FRC17_008493 [Serendipita sp. 399]|nr:hypothetical protein FRC17_008493 [Serendipita sp. 399]
MSQTGWIDWRTGSVAHTWVNSFIPYNSHRVGIIVTWFELLADATNWRLSEGRRPGIAAGPQTDLCELLIITGSDPDAVLQLTRSDDQRLLLASFQYLSLVFEIVFRVRALKFYNATLPANELTSVGIEQSILANKLALLSMCKADEAIDALIPYISRAICLSLCAFFIPWTKEALQISPL